MGKSSRSKRMRRFENQPQPLNHTDTVEEHHTEEVVDNVNVIDVVSTDVIRDVADTPVRQKQPTRYDPNSAGGLLNSILTSLLTQEYNRLQQQLLNIKQQLDAQKLITETVNELQEEVSVDENDDNDYAKTSESDTPTPE